MARRSKHQKGDLAREKSPAVEGSMTLSDAQDVNPVTIPRNRHWTVAEKLEALDEARALCYVDMKTASMEYVPSNAIRNYLYIPSDLLKSWGDIQYQIRKWPPAAKRQPSRKQAIKNPAKTDATHASHLLMTLTELKKRGIITTALHKLHPWSHPVPFLGCDNGYQHFAKNETKITLRTLKDAYEFVGQDIAHVHPGHPLPPLEFGSKRSMSSITADDYLESYSYNSHSEIKIRTMNEWLYHHAPDYEARRAGPYFQKALFAQIKDNLKTCMTMICDQITVASRQVRSAVPVRIEFDYDYPTTGVTQHCAVLLDFLCGKQVLLPVALQLTGGFVNDHRTDTLYLQGWTYDHKTATGRGGRDNRGRAILAMKRFYQDSRQIFDKFENNPVLHIADVEMLFHPTEDTWRPRRYVTTWSLFTTIMHFHRNHKRTMTPLYGRYTDLRLLIQKVYEKCPRATIAPNQSKEPFGVLRLSSFTLHSTPVESPRLKTLQTLMHSNDALIANPDILAPFVLSGEGTNQGWQFVDDERRCGFFSCVEKPNGISSRYCEYHTTEIIRSIDALPDQFPVKIPSNFLGEPQVTEGTQAQLNLLKEWFKEPSETLLIDFEFIQMLDDRSPIPFQMSIRQLDGKAVLECNVQHHVTLDELYDELGRLSNSSKQQAQTTFTRCYDDIKMNGLTIPDIKQRLANLGIDQSSRLLSWSSAADMQCLLLILRGRAGFLQDKISHKTAKNFQSINLLQLCRSLFPDLPNGTLGVVHRYIGARCEQQDPPLNRDYHNASCDTYALAEIIAGLMKI